jgi:predicted outer membrane protein
MKKTIIIGMLTSLAACGGGNGNDSASNVPSLADSAVTATSNGVANNAAANTSQALMTVNDLLMTAYQDGQAEIQLSQLALQVSTNSDVTAFAQRMISDHSVLNDEITRIAGQHNVTLPTTLTTSQQADLTRLQGLSGTDFDKAYMDLNVAVHDKDVAQFALQARQATDNDIRQLAVVAYPILKLHLASAEEINGLVNPPAFLMTAYLDGLQEIQLGQLALQKATREDVRAFAQRMITDHTALNNQIVQLAQRKGITLPTSTTPSRQAELADLTDLANCLGVDFDKAYMGVNVIAHAKDVSAARRQSEQGRDPDVTALAQASLPILTQHFQQAVDLEKAILPSLLYSAAQSQLANLQLAGLALLRDANSSIGDFARRVVVDVNNARNQLMTLAQQRGVLLPTEVSPDQATAFANLAAQAGVNFERSFLATNLTGLGQQIETLTAQNARSAEADIQAFGASLLETLKAELVSAQNIILSNTGS